VDRGRIELPTPGFSVLWPGGVYTPPLDVIAMNPGSSGPSRDGILTDDDRWWPIVRAKSGQSHMAVFTAVESWRPRRQLSFQGVRATSAGMMHMISWPDEPFSFTLRTSVPKEPVLRGEWCLLSNAPVTWTNDPRFADLQRASRPLLADGGRRWRALARPSSADR